MDVLNQEDRKYQVYSLGSIPESWAWIGETLAFRIDTQNLDDHLVTMKTETPSPLSKERISLSEQGVFSYNPDPSDKNPFYVEFSGKVGGDALSQRCLITPVPKTLPERDRIISTSTVPEKESTTYLKITKTRHSDESEDHFISGMRVVFDKNNDINNLFKSYNLDPAENELPDEPSLKGTIRNLTICADELVIHGELSLPETNVTVFARRLVLDDPNNQTGCINTSPLSYKNKRAEDATDGSHGRKAGDLAIYVHDVEAFDLNTVHFRMHGGTGQSAGLGKKGDDGLDNDTYLTHATYGSLGYSFDPPAIHFHLSECCWGTHGKEIGSWNWGSLKWPTSGKPATEPGKPGNGGDGGNFVSNRQFSLALNTQLAAKLDHTKALHNQVRKQVDKWVTQYLYSRLQSKKYSEMYDRNSINMLGEIARGLHALTESLASTRQALEERGKSEKAGMLAKAVKEGQSALKITGEATKIINESNPWRKSFPKKPSEGEQFKAGRKLMGAGARLFNLLQTMEESVNIQNSGMIDASGESAGEKAQDVFGGRAGYPVNCSDWDIRNYQDFFCNQHRSWQHLVKKNTTEEGKSYAAAPADKEWGIDGKAEYKVDVAFANAWLHPVILQTVLLYVRDVYLTAPERMEELKPVLEEYRDALESRPASDLHKPVIEQSGVSYNETLFQQTLTEVYTLIHRIESHLDYYGNFCGWTPLFSLPVCLRLYKNELDYGLKALLLARWIEQVSAKGKEVVAIADESIKSLNEATDKAVQQIDAERENIRNLRDEAHTLDQEIMDMSVRLEKKRNELLDKAEEDARIKSWVNLGVSTISTLCQVIPYGQPALGALGSAGKSIADNVINQDDPINAAGPLSDILGDFMKAKLDEKAADIKKTVDEKKKDPKKEAAADTAAKLTHVGKTIGPALSSVTEAIQGLNVSQSEVDSRLQKLEAECPEFQEIVLDLKKLNVRKAGFAQKLNESLQNLSSAYSQVTSNLLAMSSLEHVQREQLTVLDHEALLYTQSMAQHARLTLAKYLYYLAKSYEYAVLEPAEVDYRLTELMDKVASLLEKNPETGEVSRLCAEELAPIFHLELKKIEDKLIDKFIPESAGDLEIRFSAKETPDIISQLNSTGEATIRLRDFNCVPDAYERIKIANVKLEDLEFEDDMPLPESGTVELTMEPLGDGTLRAKNRLYAVRYPTSMNSSAIGSDSQQIWGARYHFGEGRIQAICPSEASLALLDLLLGDTKPAIKEKMTKCAAWTDVRMRFRRYAQSPGLKSARFALSFNWTQADHEHFVLDVRVGELDTPFIRCSPEDVNGRADGFGEIYRIYGKGTHVHLSVPLHYGTRSFSHWVVIDNTDVMESREIWGTPSLDIEHIEHNTRVFCHYKEAEEPGKTVHVPSAITDKLMSSYTAGLPEDVKERAVKMASTPVEGEDTTGNEELDMHKTKLLALVQDEINAQYHGWSSCIFNKPAGLSTGHLPPDADFTTLEGPREQDGETWQKIDYRGTIGWVSRVK